MRVRSVRASVAAALVAVLIAACGGSNPSTASPASKVPANVALYVNATVQPSSSQTQALQQVVDTVAGQGTFEKLVSKLESALAKPSSGGVSFSKDVQPWLGQQVGFAFTKLPISGTASKQAALADMVMVFPTSHPAEASKALPALEKGMPKNATVEVVGNYVLAGGKSAVAAAASTSSGNSLASSSAYQSDLAKVGSNSLALVYVNAHAIAQAQLNAAHGSTSQSLTPLLQQVPAGTSAMFGLSVTNSTVDLNIAGSGGKTPATSSAPADVSGLPSDSWLAVGTPAISAKQLQTALKQLSSISKAANSGALMPKSSHSGPVATIAKAKHNAGSYSASVTRSAKIVQGLQKVLPFLKSGLGAMRLSVAGFPNNGLKAGFSLAEPDSTTAAGTVQLLYGLAHMSKANISGSSSAFSIAASPKLTVDVGSVANKVVATVGYPKASAFTSPSSTLATNPVYMDAVSQLPSGSNVPLFVNLSELSSLVSQDAKLSSKPFAKTLAHFKYLIIGDSAGTARIVLGLN